MNFFNRKLKIFSSRMRMGEDMTKNQVIKELEPKPMGLWAYLVMMTMKTLLLTKWKRKFLILFITFQMI